MEIKRHKWDESLAWKNKKELAKPVARETCPRCRTKTVLGDYLYCPSCGWEDYEIERVYPEKERDDALRGNVSWRKALIVHNKNGKKYTLFTCVGGHRLELHLGEEEFTWI